MYLIDYIQSKQNFHLFTIIVFLMARFVQPGLMKTKVAILISKSSQNIPVHSSPIVSYSVQSRITFFES